MTADRLGRGPDRALRGPLPDQPNPLIEPALFRAGSFTGASLVAIFFSAAFGAMLLSIMLWEQGVWGWSALQAGLGHRPGPLMVPLMSFVVAGRLIARYGPAVVIALGSLAFGAGVLWWALAVSSNPTTCRASSAA